MTAAPRSVQQYRSRELSSAVNVRFFSFLLLAYIWQVGSAAGPFSDVDSVFLAFAGGHKRYLRILVKYHDGTGGEVRDDVTAS